MTGYVGIGVHPCLSPELTGNASDDLGALVFETHSSGGLEEHICFKKASYGPVRISAIP